VETRTSKFTSCIKNSNYLSAPTVGAKSQKKTTSGDDKKMGIERFNLNVARAFIGHHVNLHLKDGSVLVNVYVADAKREENNGKPAVLCITQPRKPPLKVFLKEIKWMEQLNPHLLVNA